MPDESYETLIVTREHGIVRVTLNRPGKKNAINGVMWSELSRALSSVTGPTDRILILAGAGGAFCSGQDISGTRGDEHPLFDVAAKHNIAMTLHGLSIPTIACVDGDAVGAGCNLALGCDIVFASTRSRFAEIFVRRGLSVDFGGSWILPRLIGLHRAKLLCLTGDMIDANEAAKLGLINEAYEVEQLEERVSVLAARLATGPPVAQALIKQLLNRGSTSTMSEALDAEATAQAVNIAGADAADARVAFAAKRDPVFTGRIVVP